MPATVLAKAAPSTVSASSVISVGPGGGSDSSGLTPMEQAAMDPLAFTIEFQCLQKGEHQVRLNLRFVIDDASAALADKDITPSLPGTDGALDDSVANSVKDLFARKNKRFHHVPIQLTKRCGVVDLSEQRSAVPGFAVSTHFRSMAGDAGVAGSQGQPRDGDDGSADEETAVIRDGEPTPEFLLTTATDDVVGPAAMFVLAELVLPLTATYRPPSSSAAASLELLPVSVLAHDGAGVDVHVTGRGAKKTALTASSTVKFGVRARCLKVGAWLVTVTLSFEDLGAVSPKFTFVRECSEGEVAGSAIAPAAGAGAQTDSASGTGAGVGAGAVVPAAGATAAVVVEGLSISTKPLLSLADIGDIAHNGFVAEKFATVDALAAESGRARLTVPADKAEVTVYIDNTLPGDAPRAGALLIDAVAVMSYPRGIVAPSVKDVYEWTQFDLLPDMPPRPLTLRLACLAPGTAQILVHLSTDDEIRFVLRKTCTAASVDAAALLRNNGAGSDRVVPLDKSAPPAASAAGTSTAAAGTAREDLLPGLVVALTMSPQDIDSIAVHHGVSHSDFNPHLALPERALRIPASQHFLTFFVLVIKPQNEAEAALYKPVRFGRPLLTTTFDVADPTLSGYGSEGATLTSGDQTYSLISLTFHCTQPGSTSVMVSLPLLPLEGEDGSGKPAHRAHEHVSFFLEKNCFTSGDGSGASLPTSGVDDRYETSGMGGVGLPGLSVGLTPTTHEIVHDGFPTNMYYAQRSREQPQWERAIVPTTAQSMTVYLRYALAQYSGVDPDELLIPGAVSFSAPSVVAHSSAARPTLSGEASAGGALTFKGAPLELDITFNCRYAELVPVTVTIPIEPRGAIVFTVPKNCTGRDAPRGKTVPGVQVAALTLTCHDVTEFADEADDGGDGEASEGNGDATTGAVTVTSRVLKSGRRQRCKYSPVMAAKDGVVSDDFSALSTKRKERFSVDAKTSRTPFFIRRAPRNGGDKASVTPVFGTEPMVFAHRPICRPALVHNMNFDVDAYLKKADSAASTNAAAADALSAVVRTLDTVPITIDGILRSLNITYHCVWVGVTPITVTIPIYPDTPISLYFYKECPDVDSSVLGSRIEVVDHGALSGSDSHSGEGALHGGEALLGSKGAGVIDTGDWGGHDETNPAARDTASSHTHTGAATGVTGGISDTDAAVAAAAAAAGVSVSAMDRNLVGYLDVGTDKKTFDGRANVVYRGVPRAVYSAFRSGGADGDEDIEDAEVAYPGAYEERVTLAAKLKKPVPPPAPTPQQPGSVAGGEEQAGLVSSVTSSVSNSLSAWAAWLQTTPPPRPGVSAGTALEAEEEALLADIDPEEEYAIIPPSQKSSRFYFSLPPLSPGKAPFQPFLAPFTKTLHNAYGQQIVDVKLAGPAAKGGNLTATLRGKRPPKVPGSTLKQLAAGESYIDVKYRCMRPGYTSVLVAVPLLPHSLGSVSFRVIKLCSGVRPKRVLSRLFSFRTLVLIAAVAIPLLLLLGYAALHFDAGRTVVEALGLARLSVALGFDDGSLANGLDLPVTGLYAGIGSSENVYMGFGDKNSVYANANAGGFDDDESGVEMGISDIARTRAATSGKLGSGASSTATPSKSALAPSASVAASAASYSAANAAAKNKRVTFADDRSATAGAAGAADLASAAAALGTAPAGDIDAELEELLSE